MALDIEKLKEIQEEIQTANFALVRFVCSAVESGCTWSDIGRALGITRQAAHKKFAWYLVAKRQSLEV